MVHHYREDHPEFQKATIETTVMPHPDVTDLTDEPLEPQDPPEPQTPKRKEKAVQIEEPPVKVEPPMEPFDFRCCPLPPMVPPAPWALSIASDLAHGAESSSSRLTLLCSWQTAAKSLDLRSRLSTALAMAADPPLATIMGHSVNILVAAGMAQAATRQRPAPAR